MSCQFPTIFQDAFSEVQRHLTNIGKQIDQNCRIPESVQQKFEEFAEATAETVMPFIAKALDVINVAVETAGAIRGEIDHIIDENFDPRIASIAKAALTGLPAAVVLLALPHPLPIILTGVYVILKADDFFTRRDADALDAAVGMYQGALAINCFAKAVLQRNPVHAVAGVIHTIFAASWVLANMRLSFKQ